MFKAFKYLLLASLYKKAKKSFIMLFISIIALILLVFIVNDLMSIATGMHLYMLLLFKWVSIAILLGFMGFSIFKIFNTVTNPFEKDKVKETNGSKEKLTSKKSKILAKEKLFTQSDLIMQKYIKDQ